MKRSTEDRLFARYCQSGSARALAKLFDRAAPELWRVASHLVADRHAAEDLVQETFLAAIESRDRFDPERRVVPWLLGILANLARRRRRTPGPLDGLDPAARDDDDPASHAWRREFASTLQQNLRGLPEPYREVLSLHLEGGLAARDIAARRGCPASTVRNQVMRGMDLLRQSLPRSLAGAATGAALSSSSRAAMRSRILERIGEPATSAVLFAGGLLIMKKGLLIAASVLVVGLSGWMMATGLGGAGPTDERATKGAVARRWGPARGRGHPARAHRHRRRTARARRQRRCDGVARRTRAVRP